MRQQLPESAGEALYVNDIQRVIHPGEEFGCSLLVPGCVILDPPPQDPPGDDAAAKAGTTDSGGGNSVPAGVAAKPARSK